MRKAEVILEYQNLIEAPPVSPRALYQQACSNDDATINHWQHIWLANITANKSRYGSFAERSASQEFKKYQHRPVIVAGSGPSLKVNAHELKNRGTIPLVSCLHNFHYFEDLGLAPEYYVTLDAGYVTVEEVSEGGSKTADEYWALTKNRTLVAFIATDPRLLEKWQGKILFFNSPLPSPELIKKIDEIETFNTLVSTGGNVLGACLYFAKAILGGSEIIFVGADFCFSYDLKFHAWDSKYDKELGNTISCTDIFGIRRKTWLSYYNFKGYFDSVPLRLPGIYYNCTEGGCLGAYPEGNIAAFKYLDLKDCLSILNMNDALTDNMKDPGTGPKLILYS